MTSTPAPVAPAARPARTARAARVAVRAVALLLALAAAPPDAAGGAPPPWGEVVGAGIQWEGAAPEPPTPPPGAGVPAPGARYAWPLLPAPAVGTRFRAPPHVYGPGHRGVDLLGTAGRPVLAARGGTVVFAGPVGGKGVVSVHHDDGLRTTYEPVVPTVVAGATVRAGAVIGLLVAGHQGCAPAACLHWGVRRGRLEYLDPMVLLRPPAVRLLPAPVPWPAARPAAGPRERSPPVAPRRAAVSRPRAPPTCRAAARPGGCAAGTRGTR